MPNDLTSHIGDYASSEYFTFLPPHLKQYAEVVLERFFSTAPADSFSVDGIVDTLLRHIAPLDLPDAVRRDAPQLIEAYFEYVDEAGKQPGADAWAALMPEAGALYTARLRDDGSVKGQTVRHALSKVGRNDPCPCGSGKKFKKCCIELLS